MIDADADPFLVCLHALLSRGDDVEVAPPAAAVVNAAQMYAELYKTRAHGPKGAPADVQLEVARDAMREALQQLCVAMIGNESHSLRDVPDLLMETRDGRPLCKVEDLIPSMLAMVSVAAALGMADEVWKGPGVARHRLVCGELAAARRCVKDRWHEGTHESKEGA